MDKNQRNPHALPPHILKHAPKRENFRSQEEYEEAEAYFRHRLKGLVRRSLSKGFRPA